MQSVNPSSTDGARMESAEGGVPPPSVVNESWRRAQDALKSIGGSNDAQPAASFSSPINPSSSYVTTGWSAQPFYNPAGFAPPVFSVPPPFSTTYGMPPTAFPQTSAQQ